MTKLERFIKFMQRKKKMRIFGSMLLGFGLGMLTGRGKEFIGGILVGLGLLLYIEPKFRELE